MRSGAVFWSCPRWWFGLLGLACLLICSCATPDVSPAPSESAKPPVKVPPASETPPASEAPPASEVPPDREVIEPRPAPKLDVDPDVNATIKIQKSPQEQRAWLERRVQAVVTCLEEARQAVVAAEIAGAGIEAVRPAIDALSRSEAALRQAQAQLIRGDVVQAASPLERAEVEFRAAHEFSQQT